MKTNKELSPSTESGSTAVVSNRELRSTIVYISLLPILSVLIIVLTGIINNMGALELLKNGVMVFLLTTALMFFVRFQDNIFGGRLSKTIIIISYILPIILIMLQKSPEIYTFWMIGGLLIAMLIDSKTGLLVYFNHTFILIVTFSLKPDATIHFLIMGILFILLSSALKNKSTVIYAAIILLSSNITLAFIMNSFIFEANNTFNYLASLFSILAVLVTAFLLSVIYNRLLDKATLEYTVGQIDTDALIMNNPEGIFDEHNESLAIIPTDRNIRASYDILLSEDNELLMKLKERSELLYKHSILIGDLSGRAAQIIGANEALARAGGYYHEVGKINGKSYIEEGLKLADEYSFPEELRSILRQHNIKHDKPTFVESAIVMISDNVASTIEYIIKSGDQKFTTDKVIENIFKLRMDKGTFDDSGLTIKDFKLLKEFYQNEYKTEDITS